MRAVLAASNTYSCPCTTPATSLVPPSPVYPPFLKPLARARAATRAVPPTTAAAPKVPIDATNAAGSQAASVVPAAAVCSVTVAAVATLLAAFTAVMRPISALVLTPSEATFSLVTAPIPAISSAVLTPNRTPTWISELRTSVRIVRPSSFMDSPRSSPITMACARLSLIPCVRASMVP
ncbi:hypothetical protein D3C84_794470 [compost metagenome]